MPTPAAHASRRSINPAPEGAPLAGPPDGEAARSIEALMGDWTISIGDAEAIAQRGLIAITAAEALHPEMPPIIRCPRFETCAMSRDELQLMDDDERVRAHPRISHSPRVEAYDRWTAQCAAINAGFGIPAHDEELDQADRTVNAIGRRIAAMSPTNTQEAAFKFEVLLELYSDGRAGIDDPVPIRAFLADLKRVAELEHRRA
jgi:hypothetical protein